MSNPNVEPLAQKYAVAARVPDPEIYFFHDPNMTRLDDGSLLIAAPQWRRDRPQVERTLRMLLSGDEGQTWEELPPLPYEEATPFVLDGQLLMFVQHTSHRDFNIVSSDDGGRTWSPPEMVLEGSFWNISTAMVARPEALYWAMDYAIEEDMDERSRNCMVMVKYDRSGSPLDPDVWSYSNAVPRPELPDSLTGSHFPPGGSPQISRDPPCAFGWIEPNTVEVNGRISVFNRCTIADYASTNIAGVLEYEPDTDRLEFQQFVSWPGGQCKFFVMHDQPNEMYLAPQQSGHQLPRSARLGPSHARVGLHGRLRQRAPLALSPLQHRLPQLVSRRLCGSLAQPYQTEFHVSKPRDRRR